MSDPGRTFASVFDPRVNGLNLVRLVLAAGVIGWHSFPLTGHDITWPPLRQLAASVWVDGFFAVSGFLIFRSWLRDPHPGRYLRARVLRILPGFWACLLATAVVIAPASTGAFGGDNLAYVGRNAALWVFQYDISDTPTGVPYPGVWNGSIWTLVWEFGCYLLVLLLGIAGLWRWRGSVVALFALCVTASTLVALGSVHNWLFATAARFGLMFLAGALLWQFRLVIRVSRPLAGAAAVVTFGSLWLPDYRIVAALPLAYLVLTAGVLLKRPALRLPNDISYGLYMYAFPVQQTLAVAGAWRLGIGWFALLGTAATIPLATASWFLIEKPCLRLKTVRRPPPALPGRVAATPGDPG